MAAVATSTDNHFESFSEDGSVTWSKSAPSRFYGTLTMPTFFRLNDGRLLLFWCNTTPLAEVDRLSVPTLDPEIRDKLNRGWKDRPEC